MIRTLLGGVPRIAVFLMALAPVMTGVVVLASMYSGALNELTEPTDVVRRASYPIALIGHIIGGSAMLLLGFLQFSTKLRVRYPHWHRMVGRVLVAAGMYFAASGIWMNFSANAQKDGALYNFAQNTMACALIGVLALGIYAIRNGNVAQHRNWMTRAYAITLGTATQTVMLLPVFLIYGDVKGLLFDLVAVWGWVLNLLMAEYLLRRNSWQKRAASAWV